MFYKFLILLAYLWIMGYTVSYGMYEYKNKNPRGAFGVALLLTILTMLTLGIMFKDNYLI